MPLGFTGYLKRFVQNHSRIFDPIFALFKKNAPFKWTEECQSAFQEMKIRISNEEHLWLEKSNETFVI
ncbi:hypothetical protein M153_2660008447 [Pseudoloma neurophilia]|uniref:Uncharacterized protein n=1 Tax=Pseudoloma neurophilia TaxID=146866 RepID=A0A0R0LYQ0_9MICR|nr:hypothetical protein M153_2660008447 [Pseudoloma neurophilia]